MLFRATSAVIIAAFFLSPLLGALSSADELGISDLVTPSNGQTTYSFTVDDGTLMNIQRNTTFDASDMDLAVEFMRYNAQRIDDPEIKAAIEHLEGVGSSCVQFLSSVHRSSSDCK